MLVNGTSRFAELLDGVASGQLKASTVKNIFDLPFSEGLIRSLNMLPCSYLLYYFKQKEMLAIEMGEYYKGGARAQVVQKVEKQLFDLYKNPELNVKPKELEQRGGAYYSDAAVKSLTLFIMTSRLSITLIFHIMGMSRISRRTGRWK